MAAVLQIIGAVLILVPFAWSQLRGMSTTSALYLWLNLAGSGLLAVLALIGEQWGFLLLEGCWAAVAAWSLAARRGGPGGAHSGA
jgi:hypothetical protein